MPGKELRFGTDARERMLKGASILAKAVTATLGPNGRNILIHKYFLAPAMTKDGVSVAGLMVTTEAMIAPIPEGKKPAAAPEYPPM